MSKSNKPTVAPERQIVTALNDAGLLAQPWTQWEQAERIVKRIISTALLESVLAELREMFPNEQFIVSVRDCGLETTTVRGTSREYSIQVGMNGHDFDCDTLAKAMAAVRKYHKGKRK